MSDPVGKVVIYEVHVPNPKFMGHRESIQFVNGRAELPEPRREDFVSEADYHAEYKALKNKIRRFVQTYGYEVGKREIEVSSVADKMGPETFDVERLFAVTSFPGKKVKANAESES